MWNEIDFQEALRACDFQIETLSQTHYERPPLSEMERGREECLRMEWENVRKGLRRIAAFRERGGYAEIADLMPMLQDHLRHLGDRSDWPEEYYLYQDPKTGALVE